MLALVLALVLVLVLLIVLVPAVIPVLKHIPVPIFKRRESTSIGQESTSNVFGNALA